MKGKVCLITGANRGIGHEVAQALAKRGATVVLLLHAFSTTPPTWNHAFKMLRK